MKTNSAIPRKDKSGALTPAQVKLYVRRSNALLHGLCNGTLDPEVVLWRLGGLMRLKAGRIDCNVPPEIPDLVRQTPASFRGKYKPKVIHLPCGMIHPATIGARNVLKEGETFLNGKEFIARARELESLNACAFDFYKRRENWKYLPDIYASIVFPKTIFLDCRGQGLVRTLAKRGTWWVESYNWVSNNFEQGSWVAVVEMPKFRGHGFIRT